MASTHSRITADRAHRFQRPRRCIAWSLALAILTCGCQPEPKERQSITDLPPGRSVQLAQITAEQGAAFLSNLGIVSSTPEPNVITVDGAPEEIRKAEVVLAVVDAEEPYSLEILAPASMVRMLPSNDQIAAVLGNITIGTFAFPPESKDTARAIIDVHNDRVVAVVPTRLRLELKALTKRWPQGFARARLQRTPENTHDTGVIAGIGIDKADVPSPLRQETLEATESDVVVQATELNPPDAASDVPDESSAHTVTQQRPRYRDAYVSQADSIPAAAASRSLTYHAAS